jgi:hypothetical protein
MLFIGTYWWVWLVGLVVFAILTYRTIFKTGSRTVLSLASDKTSIDDSWNTAVNGLKNAIITQVLAYGCLALLIIAIIYNLMHS